MNTLKKIVPSLVTLTLLLPLHASQAGESVNTKGPVLSSSPPDEASWKDAWDLATLYKNDANPFIQLFKLRGRYHGTQYWLDSDQGEESDWENRRARLGIQAKFFDKKLELLLEAQTNDAFDPLYDRVVDAYLKYRFTEGLTLSAGKLKPFIGAYDWMRSSNEQPTFERSQIFNQLRVDRATGALLEGETGNFIWQAGVYSNDIDKEFGQLDGGVSYSAGFGYQFAGDLGLEKADVRIDWLHSARETDDTVLNRYDNVWSGTAELAEGRWTLTAESYLASGSSSGDVFGFFIQPTYDLLPKKLQLVGRYTFSTGDGPDSVFSQSRYERNAPELTGGGRGDQYQAGYLGLQYFLNGNKLKLMAGAEYARLEGGGNGGDYDGVTLLTGIRFSF